MNTPEGKAFWNFVREAAAEIALWPSWKQVRISCEESPRGRSAS